MVEEFEIRLATIEDMKDVFDLSNDNLVRENSFNQEIIEWENHQKWFKNKLEDGKSPFYVIKNNNDLVAQIRFDRNDDEADISISVAPSFRGKGLGATLLKKASEKVISEMEIKKIIAYVKNDNAASKTIFEKAGYILKEKNEDKMRYEYNAK